MLCVHIAAGRHHNVGDDEEVGATVDDIEAPSPPTAQESHVPPQVLPLVVSMDESEQEVAINQDVGITSTITHIEAGMSNIHNVLLLLHAL